MEIGPSFDFAMLWNFFSSVIIHVIIFCVSLYYIFKKQGIDGFLLAAGSLIHILTSTFYSLILPFILSRSGYDVYHNTYLMPAVSIITFIGSLLFVTGLIILVLNHVSALRQLTEKTY